MDNDTVRIARVLAACQHPQFSHTRERHWCGARIVYVYHRDRTSPSGVLLNCSIDADIFDREIYPLVRATGGSPLSPTEGL